MKSTIKEFKQEQKQGAEEIREYRLEVKKAQRDRRFGRSDPDPWSLYTKSQKWRHRHIAYCMLRGKTYEEIEPKVRDDNEPDMGLVESIMSNYSPPEVYDAESDRVEQAEAVCSSEA